MQQAGAGVKMKWPLCALQGRSLIYLYLQHVQPEPWIRGYKFSPVVKSISIWFYAWNYPQTFIIYFGLIILDRLIMRITSVTLGAIPKPDYNLSMQILLYDSRAAQCTSLDICTARFWATLTPPRTVSWAEHTPVKQSSQMWDLRAVGKSSLCSNSTKVFHSISNCSMSLLHSGLQLLTSKTDICEAASASRCLWCTRVVTSYTAWTDPSGSDRHGDCRIVNVQNLQHKSLILSLPTFVTEQQAAQMSAEDCS